jgi:membrane-bound metal-dependent hydrolase YbcI (DUF457 family)
MMVALMPSPIGHALAGAAVVYAADIFEPQKSPGRLVAACALLAAAPDLDLFVPHFHRSATHSVLSAAVVFIVAAAVTDGVTRLRAARYGGQARVRDARYGSGGHSGGHARWRVAMLCAIAWATHSVLDWLGADSFVPVGVQLLWPFDHRYFISGWDIFPETERYRPLSAFAIQKNVRALVTELGILGTAAGALWLIRIKTLARLPSQVAGRNHAPQ